MDPLKPQSRFGRTLERSSQWATRWTGSSWAFLIAISVIAVWLLTGPLFHYSDTWQLVINTSTTIITFLMVFLIQRAQNKDALAIQLKLNELVASMEGASNGLVDVEELSEEELRTLQQHFRALAAKARKERDFFSSHSVDEAERRHQWKSEAQAEPDEPK